MRACALVMLWYIGLALALCLVPSSPSSRSSLPLCSFHSLAQHPPIKVPYNPPITPRAPCATAISYSRVSPVRSRFFRASACHSITGKILDSKYNIHPVPMHRYTQMDTVAYAAFIF